RLLNARLYNERLSGVGDLVLPNIKDVDSGVFHLYVMRTEKRDQLMKYLSDNGVGCGIHYPVPIYSLGAYKWLGYNPQDFPVTEIFSREILSLPMYAELREDKIEKIAELIKKFYKEN
ncbi:MAG: DegT/DnrJ/EryC1/StrS family aminotransferase, partial [Candidatus Omnitrophota bacterium]